MWAKSQNVWEKKFRYFLILLLMILYVFGAECIKHVFYVIDKII